MSDGDKTANVLPAINWPRPLEVSAWKIFIKNNVTCNNHRLLIWRSHRKYNLETNQVQSEVKKKNLKLASVSVT